MPELKRELNLFLLTAYGVGIILGAGIYVLVGIAAGSAGNAIWLSFIIGSLLAMFSGLSYAELSSIYPKEAAEYYYIEKTIGNKMFAFLIGWSAIVAELFAAAAVALGFANYLASFVQLSPVIIAILLICLIGTINFIGIKQSAIVNLIFTAAETLGLLIIIFLGFYSGNVFRINYLDYPSLAGIFYAAALIFFAFIGFEDVVNVAEETKHASKIVPKALILSLLISTLIYVLVGIAAVSLVPYQQLAKARAPLALAASKVFGSNAFSMLSLFALMSTFNTVLILNIVTSRMIWGMAADGSFPKILSSIHKKTRTPHYSIFLTTLATLAFILFEEIGLVAEVTNFFIFLVYASVNLCLIVSRIKSPRIVRPFKAPLNIGNHSLVPYFGLATSAILLVFLKPDSIIIGLVALLAGFLYYKIRAI